MKRNELKDIVETFILMGSPIYCVNHDKDGNLIDMFVLNVDGKFMPVSLVAHEKIGKFDMNAPTVYDKAVYIATNKFAKDNELKEVVVSTIQSGDLGKTNEILTQVLSDIEIEKACQNQSNILLSNMLKNKEVLDAINNVISELSNDLDRE